MILLPALLKEVLAVEHLGFQVAPGLSSATGEQLALVKNESPRTAFLTDNDESGRNLHSKIRTAGIPDRLASAGETPRLCRGGTQSLTIPGVE